MREVTDHNMIAKLNALSQGREVTDPNLIAKLNAVPKLEQSRSTVSRALGTFVAPFEAGASLATGVVEGIAGGVTSGLAGLGHGAYTLGKELAGGSSIEKSTISAGDKASETIGNIQSALSPILSYKPQTPEGEYLHNAIKGIMDFFVTKPAQVMGETAQDITKPYIGNIASSALGATVEGGANLAGNVALADIAGSPVETVKGIAKVPIEAVKTGGRAIAHALPKGTPEGLMLNAVKPSGKGIGVPEMRKISKILTEEKIPVNETGLSHAESIIENNMKEVGNIVKEHPTKLLDINKVIADTEVVRKQLELRRDSEGLADYNKVINDFKKDYLRPTNVEGRLRGVAEENTLFAPDAQAYKQRIYDELRDPNKYGKTSNTEILTKKLLANSIKEGLESIDPRLKPLNEKVSDMLTVRPHLEKAVGKAIKANPFDFSDEMAIMLGAVTGGPLGAVAMEVGKKAAYSTSAKSRLAIALREAKNKPISKTASAIPDYISKMVNNIKSKMSKGEKLTPLEEAVSKEETVKPNRKAGLIEDVEPLTKEQKRKVLKWLSSQKKKGNK